MNGESSLAQVPTNGTHPLAADLINSTKILTLKFVNACLTSPALHFAFSHFWQPCQPLCSLALLPMLYIIFRGFKTACLQRAFGIFRLVKFRGPCRLIYKEILIG